MQGSEIQTNDEIRADKHKIKTGHGLWCTQERKFEQTKPTIQGCSAHYALPSVLSMTAILSDDNTIVNIAHPVKIDLNRKLDPKQKTIQAFNIDA